MLLDLGRAHARDDDRHVRTEQQDAPGPNIAWDARGVAHDFGASELRHAGCTLLGCVAHEHQ